MTCVMTRATSSVATFRLSGVAREVGTVHLLSEDLQMPTSLGEIEETEAGQSRLFQQCASRNCFSNIES